MAVRHGAGHAFAGRNGGGPAAFQRLVDTDGTDSSRIHLAIVCRNLNDEPAEAPFGRPDPRPGDLVALFFAPTCSGAAADAAAVAYNAAAAVAPPIEQLRPPAGGPGADA
jgi:hypothetical protein